MNEEIIKTLEVLRSGGVIVYPTETVWGLGCDATNEKASEKIHLMKGTESSKSMLVLVDSPDMICRYVKEIPGIAIELLEVSDTPLTIIYPGATGIAGNVTGPDGTIGIRVTTDPFCRELIRKFRKPIVSTSANRAGMKNPVSYSNIDPVLLDEADYVVKWRRNEKQADHPSSIIKVGLKGEVVIIRK